MTTEDIIERQEYPPGVPCWIETEQPDPDAAAAFYAGLFAWEFESMLPPGIEDRYLVARFHGLDVAAIASPTPGIAGSLTWNTYVSVADVDATAEQAAGLGAEIMVAPVDAGPPNARAGRWAAFIDPDGAHLRLWQPGYRSGAQLVNGPQTWNSSDLTTNDVERAKTFYSSLFGWEADRVDFGGGDADGESFMWRLPGYGDFLAIGDPDIKVRHSQPWVPPGFSDAIGWMTTTCDDSTPHWTVTFSVDGTDATVDRAVELGGTVVSPPDDRGGGVVRMATLRDPQGAEFLVGTYDPSALSES